jgi:CBS domain
MRVSELMSRDVVTIADTETCHGAIEQMCRRKVRHLPVLDGAGALVGIVTDRDLRHWRFAPDTYRQIGAVPLSTLLQGVPVRGLMSAPVRCISTAADVGASGRVDAARQGGMPSCGRRAPGRRHARRDRHPAQHRWSRRAGSARTGHCDLVPVSHVCDAPEVSGCSPCPRCRGWGAVVIWSRVERQPLASAFERQTLIVPILE